MSYDLIIRGGMIVDGTGGEPFIGDLAVKDGKIAAIGALTDTAAREMDATGLLVTPGFVDIHTHYDGQVTWGAELSPSSNHGVTTAVMGNCGVGFAPCKPEDHDNLIHLMEGVEDIPHAVLAEGLEWNWESFPEYLDAVEARPHDIDFAIQVPHAALRVYVMGERGANREPATQHDIAAMAALARDAIKAGALGFSTSRTLNHRTSKGDPTPTLTAAEDELLGIAMGLKEAGGGVLQFVTDFNEPEREFNMLRHLVEASGRPLSVSLAQSPVAPLSYQRILAGLKAANNDGLKMRAQVCGRPVSLLLGLELTLNPFTGHPAFQEIADKPLDEKVRILKDPEIRAKLLSDEGASENPFMKSVLRNFDNMFPLSDPPNYEPEPEMCLGAQARAKGISPQELALDLLLAEDGHAMLLYPFLNYASGSLEPSREMIEHPNTVLGLGDGGAHVGIICDGSFPTYMLTHWTRDRTRGPKLDLAQVIKAQTRDTAEAVGLEDRGILKPGYKADINIIDYDRLTLNAPRITYDLPAGGKRLFQDAEGYVATLVSGVEVMSNGQPTGALPGKLVRGAQKAPVAVAAE
ncbi:MAG: D-aminoacylase [Alphaproteobacteria bacterium]|nr:MAG: D-aminoacylase [Alphaproteobacteria bacterium]